MAQPPDERCAQDIGEGTGPGPTVDAGRHEMIDRVKDPVCRIEIRLDQAVEAALFDGERVYFYSPSCYAAFLDTPHRYRGWASDRGRGHGRATWSHVPWRRAVAAGASAP